MSNSIVKYEIKLQPSVIFILAILAIGVCTFAFKPLFEVKEVRAWGNESRIVHAHEHLYYQIDGSRIRHCAHGKDIRKCFAWHQM